MIRIPDSTLCGRLSFPSLETAAVPQPLRKWFLDRADEMLSEPFDHLPLSLYRDFSETGSREHYETPYFRKRRRLSTLVIAELLENSGRYISRIEDEIWELFAEPAWVIPPHNCYIRDTPQLPVPDTGRPVLDLFAMETGEILALSLNLLGEMLDPALRRSISTELRRRVIDPYIGSWFWWMGGRGDEKLNNWTVWCTQNALLTAFSIDLDADTRAAVMDKALLSLSDWYSQYGEDGCCDEGAQYWHAAGLCFFGCLCIINQVTGNALTSLFSENKVRNIASYIMNMHVSGDWYLNFSDCSPRAGLLGAREYLFGRAVGNTALIRQAMLDTRSVIDAMEKGDNVPEDDNSYNLWYMWLKVRYSGEMCSSPLPAESSVPGYVYYPSVGISIYRDGGTLLAVKTGCNDDSHNHNDTGSVILCSGSHPLLIDIGVETYTKKTFSPERYTLPPMQSLYHNVVNFGGKGQAAGREYRAEDVVSDSSSISMELSSAYPEGTVGSYRRKVVFSRDLISFSESVKDGESPVLSLMTMDRPSVSSSLLSFAGWSISFSKCGEIKTEEIKITDKRLRIAWPERLYRTLIPFADTLEWAVHIGK